MSKFKVTCLLAVLASANLVACGGGGGSTTQSNPPPVVTPPTQTPIATSAAGTRPSVTAANCAALQASSVTPPVVSGADMQAVSDLLTSVDTAHGLSEFSRLPSTLMWWVRASGTAVDVGSVGGAIHETNHEIDTALSQVCYSDGFARYFANNAVHVTGLQNGQTANYSIVSETYPAALQSSRSQRYATYITGSSAYSGNDFHMLLDELNAYSGGAHFEAKTLANSSYAYIYVQGDYNAGGMVDFMAYLQYYLQSARLNHASSHSSIVSQTDTLAFIQFAWSRAETILSEMYPYSIQNGGTQFIPLDVLKAIYSPALLSELDTLGITHKTAADWSSTYFK
jgi:hypothetical protein